MDLTDYGLRNDTACCLLQYLDNMDWENKTEICFGLITISNCITFLVSLIVSVHSQFLVLFESCQAGE